MKTIVLDFDDFSLENNNLYYLKQLKEYYPELKVSMFMIPFDSQYYRKRHDFEREQALKEIKGCLDWIELIPHGLLHTPREFEKVTYDVMDICLAAIDEQFKKYDLPYVKGFKAPYWLYTEDVVKCLDDNDWFIAVDRNQPEAKKTKKFYVYSHSIHEPFWKSEDQVLKLHGHISPPSENSLPENMLNLMKMPHGNFKYVSEMLQVNDEKVDIL